MNLKEHGIYYYLPKTWFNHGIAFKQHIKVVNVHRRGFTTILYPNNMILSW